MKSQSITLKCSHSGSKLVKCKALAKIAVLDPKIIRSENKQQTKRNRTVFKIYYAFPDLKDVKKYGKTKVLKPNSEKCIPTGKYYAIKRSFRAINGKLSVTRNKDQTQSQFENSNLLDLMSTDEISKYAEFSLKKEIFSARKRIANSKTRTRTEAVTDTR